MKKSLIILILAVIFLGIFSFNSLYGFFYDERFGLGFSVGFYEPDNLAGSDYYLDSEVEYFLQGRYFINSHWSVESAYGYYSHDDYYGVSSNTGFRISSPGKADFKEFGKGSFTLKEKPFFLIFNYHWNGFDNQRVVPFMGIGLSYINCKYIYHRNSNYSAVPAGSKNSLSDGEDWQDFSSSENEWGWVAQVGVEYFSNPNVSIFGKVIYHSGSVNMEIAPNLIDGNVVLEEFDVKGFSYQAGVTYYFPKDY